MQSAFSVIDEVIYENEDKPKATKYFCDPCYKITWMRLVNEKGQLHMRSWFVLHEYLADSPSNPKIIMIDSLDMDT